MKKFPANGVTEATHISLPKGSFSNARSAQLPLRLCLMVTIELLGHWRHCRSQCLHKEVNFVAIESTYSLYSPQLWRQNFFKYWRSWVAHRATVHGYTFSSNWTFFTNCGVIMRQKKLAEIIEIISICGVKTRVNNTANSPSQSFSPLGNHWRIQHRSLIFRNSNFLLFQLLKFWNGWISWWEVAVLSNSAVSIQPFIQFK